ncbi:MAG: RNA-directed DNA polymerase [Bacteroidales bacterium]|nr:RNA-directed DNA polymerase [Bacteroidales bacterium]
MTSEERREGRYQRRKRKRIHASYEDVINRDALAKAAHDAALGVKYKESVKRYMLYELVNIGRLNNKLKNHRDICKGFVCFPVTERGKRRDIMSIHISERVAQKSLNKNALIPVLFQSVIYDNAAGQKGKGTSFALERMKALLQRYYRKHGNAGYALKIDFKGYFGNLDHGIAKQMIRDHFDDDGILWLTDRFIDSYYEHSGQRKGLGLGSEVNQTIAVAYPDRIDHYIKEALRIKCYVRYMDDLVLVHESRDYLLHCLEEIERLCGELKITVNHNKTYIAKLSTGFEFLKKRFSVTETGKILRKPSRSAVTRTRRVIKRHKGLVDRGIISYEDARVSYFSRRASLETKTANRTIYNLDKLFMKLHEKEAI